MEKCNQRERHGQTRSVPLLGCTLRCISDFTIFTNFTNTLMLQCFVEENDGKKQIVQGNVQLIFAAGWCLGFVWRPIGRGFRSCLSCDILHTHSGSCLDAHFDLKQII